MNQVLQLADLALVDPFEQPPHRAFIRNPHPSGNPPQHPVGPQQHALADVARTTDHTDKHEKDRIDKLVLRIVPAFVAYLLAEQSAESQRVEKFDHRNQPGLASQVPPAGFVADFRGRSARRACLLDGIFAHGKGDSSG